MKPETKIVNKIIPALRKLGGVAIKLHGGPMQMAGLPDILFLLDGRTFFFEVKQPGKDASALQAAKMTELELAGARCFVVHSVDEVLAAISGLQAAPPT